MDLVINNLNKVKVSKIICLRAIYLLFLLGICRSVSAQEISREYQVKSVFLYNFSHFVEWQNDIFNSPTDPFIIGIIGEDPFGNYINETVRGEKVLGHNIIVQRYANIKEAKYCHILYLNIKDNRQLKDALNAINGRHILTVSDVPDFAKSGGMIQFFTEKNKTRLLINIAAAKSAGLIISSKLLRLAVTLNN